MHTQSLIQMRQMRSRHAPAAAHAAALAMLALACCVATAADAAPDARARYQAEKTACIEGQSHQDRATCLKEASAALAESTIRPARLAPVDHAQNALIRCTALPTDERDACQRRIEGEGSSSGSIEGGGILREVATPDNVAPDQPMWQQKQ
jgi:hypothetical protein